MKEALLALALAALAVTLLFGAAIVQNGWSRSDIEDSLGPVESRPVLPFTPLLESDRYHGFAVQIHNRALLADFKKCINDLADLGADTVMLSAAAYQENGASSTIAILHHSAPTQADLAELIGLAKSRGMRTIFMPVVLLDNPRGTEWRGKITPTDPDRWWSDYREFIRYYAEAAHNAGADLFMVGSELNRMETSTGRWRNLIGFLRKNYPRMKLGYSANWDRYWKVAFWNESKPGANDGLDFAGCTSYYELARKSDAVPSVDTIVQGWQDYTSTDETRHHYRDKLIAWQRTIGKPVIFTEIGYFSKRGTAYEPWNYCSEEKQAYSEEEQANCYQAFLKVWGDPTPQGEGVARRSPRDILGGMLFWEWNDGPGGPKDDGYTPKGKQAEQVIRDYFAKVHPGVITSGPGLTKSAAASQPAAAAEH
jgi:hypothetical protein